MPTGRQEVCPWSAHSSTPQLVGIGEVLQRDPVYPPVHTKGQECLPPVPFPVYLALVGLLLQEDLLVLPLAEYSPMLTELQALSVEEAKYSFTPQLVIRRGGVAQRDPVYPLVQEKEQLLLPPPSLV